MTSFEVISEIPSAALTHYIPAASGERGIIVAFQGQTDWVGVFAGDRLAKDGFTGVLSLSNESMDCVVFCRGQGYVVDPNKVGHFEPLGLLPVTWAKFFPTFDVLIVVTPWEISGIMGRAVQWETGRISIDGISIDSSTGDVIEGRVDTLEGQERFVLNVSNGHISGVTPLPFA